MNLLKKLFLIAFYFNLFVLTINAKDLNPSKSLIASGGVSDLVLVENKLFVATTASTIDIFDISTDEKIDSIKLPKIKDFIGDSIDSKIYSVDVLNDSVLILSQNQVWNCQCKMPTPIVPGEERRYRCIAPLL